MLEKPLNPPCQATLGKQSNIFHNNPENTQSICVYNFIDKSSRSEICIATRLHMTQLRFFVIPYAETLENGLNRSKGETMEPLYKSWLTINVNCSSGWIVNKLYDA